MTLAELEQFKDDYSNRFGELLDTAVSVFSQYESSVDGFIKHVDLGVDNFIKTQNRLYDYDSLADWQKVILQEAKLEQAFYVVHGIDFSRYAGINVSNGSVADLATIRERTICEDVKTMLALAGILYTCRNVSTRGVSL